MGLNEPNKISAYSACNAPEANASLVIAGNTAGVNTTFKISLLTLFGNNAVDFIVSNTKTLSANVFVIRNKSTPGTSADASPAGRIWYDDNYLYVSTANNVTKRVALGSF